MSSSRCSNSRLEQGDRQRPFERRRQARASTRGMRRTSMRTSRSHHRRTSTLQTQSHQGSCCSTGR
eukprot:4110893-Prymnesium_polylepis.1